MNALAAPVADPVVITAYEALRTDIAIAVQNAEGKSFDYRDAKDNKLCRSYLHGLRLIRGKIEGARKAAKATALEYGRRVDSLAKEMETQVDTLIAPHDAEISKIDAEEKARIAKHTEAINRLVQAQTFYAGRASDHVRAALEKAKAFDTATLEEFKPEGDAKLLATIRALEAELAVATKREADDAELQRLRQEAAERAEADRIERIKREAAEEERTRAERARIVAEERAEAERAQAAAMAKAKIEAAKLAEEKAKRQAAEAKEREAKLKADLIAANERERKRLDQEENERAEATLRRAARDKAERENREAMVSQIAEDIASSGSTPREIAEAIVAGMIRNVSVSWGS